MTIHTPIPSRRRGVPAWGLWLTIFLLLVGGVYFASNLSGTNPALAGGIRASGSAAPGGVDIAAALGVAKKAGCQGCHGQEWTGGIGPNLVGIVNGPKTPDLTAVAKAHPDDWLQLWIAGTDPAVAKINRGPMPKFGDGTLSPDEIDTIAAYLKTLK